MIPPATTFYTHLACSKSGEVYDKNTLHNYSAIGKPLVARYDLARGLDRDVLHQRPHTLWRYRELLPVEDDAHIVSLGEGMTPILPMPRLAAQWGLPHLRLKDEAGNPTGSFKARGLCMAISKAKELGVRACAIPTAGNAGGAMSAYCAKAGMEAHVYMPVRTPEVFRKECEYFGARVTLVDGTIRDCAQRLAQERRPDWFDVSTLKEPFRLEGKKTMGYEIAEQYGWALPDVILYPTGGGTGLIGMWKAFEEMQQLGWIGPERPRMVAVQTDACYPIVRAFQAGARQAEPFPDPAETISNGLRVPVAFADELILDALYQSGGTALTVSDADTLRCAREVATAEGLLLAPEGAAVYAAMTRLLATGWIKPDEKVLLVNTGSAYKYMENM